jgi:hypothetical protein
LFTKFVPLPMRQISESPKIVNILFPISQKKVRTIDLAGLASYLKLFCALWQKRSVGTRKREREKERERETKRADLKLLYAL